MTLTIAKEEWRYWRRSNLAMAGVCLFALLLIATSVLTALRVDTERQVRLEQQAQAEAAFIAQPDRHPHRMVHYGHYVFRTPAPLAVFDPGLDPVTGQSIFLEGHRQNTAMFAETASSANLGGLPQLTPALVYQLFAPLLLILLAHAAIVREREAATLTPLLAQGVGGVTILAGKALALLAVTGVLLVPILFTGLFSLSRGEALLPVLSLLVIYGLYLLLWGGLVLLVSTLLRDRSLVLATLAALWILLCLIVPGLAVNAATSLFSAPGKVETELTMLANQRNLDDGHNANAPVFDQLRKDLLAEYGVDAVEDLPVNLRGLVSLHAEARLTKILNEYAEKSMASEASQAGVLRRFGWLSPMISVGTGSRALVGSDLEAHHRFLREAEELRFEFVQALNHIHAHQLTYVDDINRSTDTEAARRTRVSADNWALLSSFQFAPAAPASRLTNALAAFGTLFAWFALIALACMQAGRRLGI